MSVDVQYMDEDTFTMDPEATKALLISVAKRPHITHFFLDFIYISYPNRLW